VGITHIIILKSGKRVLPGIYLRGYVLCLEGGPTILYPRVFFPNGAAPAPASKRCIRPAFTLFIQRRLARGLITIIQAKATKKRCQSTTKLVRARGQRKRSPPPPTLTRLCLAVPCGCGKGGKGRRAGGGGELGFPSRSPHGGDARGVVIPCTLELLLTKVQLLGWVLMKNIFDRNKRRIIQLIISCAPN
jgi:hypothetical protein